MASSESFLFHVLVLLYIPSFAASKVPAGTLVQMASDMYQRAGEPQDMSVSRAPSSDRKLFFTSHHDLGSHSDLLEFSRRIGLQKTLLDTLTSVLGPIKPPAEE